MTRFTVLAVWITLATALCILQILAMVRWARISGLRNLGIRLTRSRIASAALLLGWMWTGWHFFAR